MMPSLQLKYPLVAALACYPLLVLTSCDALQLQPLASLARAHHSTIAFTSEYNHVSYHGVRFASQHRHKTRALSARKKDADDDHDEPSSSKRRKHKKSSSGNEDGDNDDGDDDLLGMNDYIDFDSMNKRFDDIPEYGMIRSIESPYDNYNPIDPLSVDEIESWMAKNNLIGKQQQKKQFWSRMFPWVKPLTSILLPNQSSPSPSSRTNDASSRSSLRKQLTNKPRKEHSTFNDGLSSPRVLRGFMSTPNSGRNLILSLNILAFLYQIITAVQYLPGFNRVLAASVAGDAYSAAALSSASIPQWTRKEVILRALGLIGGGAGVVIASGSSMGGQMGRIIGRGPIAAHSMGPFFLDWAHQPYPLSHFQKHRYLTSGFLHGSLVHIGMNMRALLSLPSWLEHGLGKGLYLSAYVVAIVTGNIAHTLSSMSGRAAASLCIGASGGICGLYGLMLASLMKMGNGDAVYYVAKQLMWLLAFGVLVPNVSNAGHIGGFLGGWLVGFIFG